MDEKKEKRLVSEIAKLSKENAELLVAVKALEGCQIKATRRLTGFQGKS